MEYTTKMLNEIQDFVSKIALIAMILPILFAILNFKNLNKSLKIIFIFSIFLFSISLILHIIVLLVNNYKDFYVPILKKLQIKNMSFISILAHLNNFVVLGWYFYEIIKSRELSKIIKLTSFVLAICSLVNYFFIEGYNVQSVFNSTASSIFCILLPFVHLWYIYNDIDSKVVLLKNSYFWISLGILLPNLIGLFINIAGKKIEATDTKLFHYVNIIHDLIQIVGYIFIAIGFYYARYTKYMPKPTT